MNAKGFDFVKEKASVDGHRIGKIAVIAVLGGNPQHASLIIRHG